MDLASYRTDPKLEAEGVWMEVGDGAELLIARIGNPAYKALGRRLYKPYEHFIDAKRPIPEGAAVKILVENMSQNVLKGWRGLQIDGDDVGEYSAEKARQILADYPDFRDFVYQLANTMELFRAEKVAEAGKGSKKS